MSFQGSLNSLTLPDLISLISGLRKTGTLSLVGTHEERGIVFFEGNVVYATTREFDGRLGSLLVGSGAIDRLEVECEAEYGDSSEEPFFGARLLESGKVDECQLRDAVRAQVLDVMKEVLGWQEGVFFFDDAVGAFHVPEHGSISSQQIILEAARFRDEDLFASELFPDRDVVLVQDGESSSSSGSEDRDHVISLLDGKETIGDVILGSPLGPQKTAVLLKEMLESGEVVASADAVVEKKVTKIEDVIGCPTAPHVPGSLFFQLSQEELSRETIGDLLGKEPLLAAKVLKTLTRANRELRRDEMSLDQLVGALGEFQLRSVLLPEAIRGLNYPTHSCYWEELWEHSRVCASVCEFVAEQVSYAFPGEAYLAGLLHNLGALLLLDLDPEAYRNAVDASIEQSRDIEEIEAEIFGINHAELGARCAEKWKFPRLLLQAMRDHHKVEATVNNPLLHIVSVADGLAQASGYRIGFQSTRGVQFEGSLQRLKISRQQAAVLYAHVMRISGRKPEEVTVTA